MELNDLDFLEKRWGVDKEEPLWWHFNYPKDPREFMSFDNFCNELVAVGKIEDFEYKIYKGWNIPITLLPLMIEGREINLFVTARPYTPKETYDRNFLTSLEDLAKDIKDKKKWPLLSQFLPHVRGFAKEIKDNTFFYYHCDLEEAPTWNTNFENNSLIKKALQEKKIDFIDKIHFLAPLGGVYLTDKSKLALDACASGEKVFFGYTGAVKEKITGRIKSNNFKFERRSLPPSFKRVEYNKFKKSKENLVSYYPVFMEDIEESVPFLLCNNIYGERDLFNIGVCWDGNTFVAIKDEYFAKESSEKISKSLDKKIIPVVFDKEKGSYKYRILS